MDVAQRYSLTDVQARHNEQTTQLLAGTNSINLYIFTENTFMSTVGKSHNSFLFDLKKIADVGVLPGPMNSLAAGEQP